MALKLPFHLGSVGRNTTQVQPERDSRVAKIPTSSSGASTVDAGVTFMGRTAPKVSSIRLPLVGHLPLLQQIRVLFGVLIFALLLATVLALIDGREGNRTASRVNLTADSLMHSQRLAHSSRLATAGSAVAFGQMKDSFDKLEENFKKLVETTSGKDAGAAIQKTRDKWEVSKRAASSVLAEENAITTFNTALSKLTQENQVLLKMTEETVALMLQNRTDARTATSLVQLSLLSQRILGRANQLANGNSTDTGEASVQLPREAEAFGKALGDFKTDVLKIERSLTKHAELIAQMTASAERFVRAKDAERVLLKESEEFKNSLSELRNEYAPRKISRGIYWILMIAIGFMAIVAAFFIGKLFLDDSRRRAGEAEYQRELAERQEAEVKRINGQNQAAILRLMNELQEVADGDLTIKATVSEDITGAIADSVNYTVEELRSLVGRINRTAEQVAGASGQAAARSQELLIASAQQSNEIRKTGESVLRMAEQINDVSASAMESANVARQSLKAAEEGQHAVENAISGMNDIRFQIQETSKRIKRLGESSQEIGEIIELITDITEQTNVLALNAAIQAASAGEAGRGFSVVAEEVQRLAERSQEAAKQIGALIRTIQTDTQDAVTAMEISTQGVVEGAKLSDEAGRALGGIGNVSRELAELIERISSSTSEQALSAGEVAKNIQRILTVTEHTSAGTEQTAQSIRELSDLATELKSSVSRFRVA